MVSGGRVGFEVRPLRPRGAFRVRTSQVRIDVVGTRFSVDASVRCTRVEVARGLVQVTASHAPGAGVHRLGPGAGRTFCRPPSSKEVLSAEERMIRRALSLLLDKKDIERADDALARYLARYPGGEFAQEALFQRILVKRRLGQRDRADLLTDRFLARFPASPLSRRLRLSRKKDPPLINRDDERH
jgi:hypothetical protein